MTYSVGTIQVLLILWTFHHHLSVAASITVSWNLFPSWFRDCDMMVIVNNNNMTINKMQWESVQGRLTTFKHAAAIEVSLSVNQEQIGLEVVSV